MFGFVRKQLANARIRVTFCQMPSEWVFERMFECYVLGHCTSHVTHQSFFCFLDANPMLVVWWERHEGPGPPRPCPQRQKLFPYMAKPWPSRYGRGLRV